MSNPTISLDEYLMHRDQYSGYCVDCQEFQHGDYEPDTRKAYCEICGEHTIYGVEEALLMDFFNVLGEPA